MSGRSEGRRRLRAAASLGAGIALALAAACVPTRWSADELTLRYPVLGRIGRHRLADAHPYVLPAAGEVALFLCRWPDGEAIPVSLPPDASPDERTLLARALSAWETELGLAFELGGAPVPGRGLEIRFVEADAQGREAANTLADCAVSPGPGERLDARVVHASVHLRRTQLDALGREVPHSEAELLGAALHELGHALGFQGHARTGASVMVRNVEAVRRAGRHLLEGRPFHDTTLRALYALPSGAVVRRAPVPRARTRPVDLMLAFAAARSLAGPFARVGDRVARVAWSAPDGLSFALYVLDLPGLWREPEQLAIVPGPRAARLLGSPAEDSGGD